LEYSGEINTSINWGKGVANFQSEKFDLTDTFNHKDVIRIVDTEYGLSMIDYSGEVTFSGTVTLNSGETCTIPDTTVSGSLTEMHTLPIPQK
jgi:hypothetical protein